MNHHALYQVESLNYANVVQQATATISATRIGNDAASIRFDVSGTSANTTATGVGSGGSLDGKYTLSDKPGTSNKGFRCLVCNRNFSQKGNLKTHAMTHSGERPHECQVCGKNFIQKGNLDTHMKIHTDTKDHKCQHCDRGFTQRGNLKTHIRSVHTKEKPYACTQCGKAFAQKGNMLTHYRTHDKQSRFPCNICGKTFSQKVSSNHNHSANTATTSTNSGIAAPMIMEIPTDRRALCHPTNLYLTQGNLKTHQQRHGRTRDA